MFELQEQSENVGLDREPAPVQKFKNLDKVALVFMNFGSWVGEEHESIKGTLSPHKNCSYMMHMDPMSTKKQEKKSSEFYNPLKKALKVQFSVLNRAENASMAPHCHPRMCHWLQNFIPIGVNGSRILSFQRIFISQGVHMLHI